MMALAKTRVQDRFRLRCGPVNEWADRGASGRGGTKYWQRRAIPSAGLGDGQWKGGFRQAERSLAQRPRRTAQQTQRDLAHTTTLMCEVATLQHGHMRSM